jgi:hypothetical protein
MLSSHHGLITALWVALNLLPLLIGAVVWFVFDNWLWGLLLIVFYPLYFVPYGFFIAMPLMVWFFRKPASIHRR